MTGMMCSKRNRSILRISRTQFKGHRKTGKPMGKRAWRRAIRKVEARRWKKETTDE